MLCGYYLRRDTLTAHTGSREGEILTKKREPRAQCAKFREKAAYSDDRTGGGPLGLQGREKMWITLETGDKSQPARGLPAREEGNDN